MLRGPEGLGHLQLDATQIAFNGNAFLGQAADAFPSSGTRDTTSSLGQTGQLVQLENGMLRWIDAPARDADAPMRSSAS